MYYLEHGNDSENIQINVSEKIEVTQFMLPFYSSLLTSYQRDMIK